MAGTSKKGYERGWPEQRDGWRLSRMEEVSNNGGPWCARMNSHAPRQKERKRSGPDNTNGILLKLALTYSWTIKEPTVSSRVNSNK